MRNQLNFRFPFPIFHFHIHLILDEFIGLPGEDSVTCTVCIEIYRDMSFSTMRLTGYQSSTT